MEILDFTTMALVSIVYTKDQKEGLVFHTTIGSNDEDTDDNLVQYVLDYLKLDKSQVQNKEVVRLSQEQYLNFLEKQIKDYLITAYVN